MAVIDTKSDENRRHFSLTYTNRVGNKTVINYGYQATGDSHFFIHSVSNKKTVPYSRLSSTVQSYVLDMIDASARLSADISGIPQNYIGLAHSMISDWARLKLRRKAATSKMAATIRMNMSELFRIVGCVDEEARLDAFLREYVKMHHSEAQASRRTAFDPIMSSSLSATRLSYMESHYGRFLEISHQIIRGVRDMAFNGIDILAQHCIPEVHSIITSRRYCDNDLRRVRYIAARVVKSRQNGLKLSKVV